MLSDELSAVFPEELAHELARQVADGEISQTTAHEMIKHEAIDLFARHLRTCPICRQRTDPSGQPLQPILCPEGERLLNIYQPPAELAQARRETAQTLAAGFAASLTEAGPPRPHQMEVRSVWNGKAYKVVTTPGGSTGWQGTVSSKRGIFGKEVVLRVAAEHGETPEQLHARLVAMAQFEDPKDWQPRKS